MLVSCGGRQTTASQEAGDTVVFKYATQLSIVRHKDYTEVVVKNPWKEGKILHSYLLVPDSIDPQDISLTSYHSPLTSTIVRTPLRRSVMFTTVHCAMLMSFGCEQSIAGVADLKYIKIPWIHEQVKAGRITDVGEGMSPVVEKIIDQRPDALFLSPFENSGGYGRLEEIGIPIIECAEYMEPSPLARAEWLRFYGMLFGCEARADSLFAVVDSSYNALKKLFTVDSLSSCVPTVASGKAERTDDYSAASFAGEEGLASKSSVNCKPSTVNYIKDIRISDHGNWRHLHWNALQSAYGESPFFDYYQDDIRPFFEKNWDFLLDFNEAIRLKMCELIDIQPKVCLTEGYTSISSINYKQSTINIREDYRSAIRPKNPEADPDFEAKPYYQVYQQKHGFLPNLSILDLLFNMGPESIFYL